MKVIMDFSPHLVSISGLLAFVLLFYNIWRVTVYKAKSKELLAPEPSGALPIIGHLHLLGAQKTFARTLGAMADQYGPIFTIRLGVHRAVVVSNSEIVKECFTTNDRVLASRPRSSHGEHLSYNYAAFGFAPYGTYWRDVRKIAMIQLLSSQRLKLLRQVQISEVNTLIKDFYLLSKSTVHEQGSFEVVISEWFQRLTINMITRMIAGKKYFTGANDTENQEGKRIGELMKEFMYISGTLVPSDLIPFLGWTNNFIGPVNAMKRIAREMDCVLESWIEEHKSKRVKSEGHSNNTQDLIDVMLAEIKDDFMFGHSRENIIKATAMTLIIAGADTTSVALTWILANLLNNRRALELAQEELDLKVGRERWVEDSDIGNLVYIQAIVKETLRLYPPGPVSVPHEAIEDCFIAGYQMPKGTRLIVNLWKLHRDPNVWSNPDEFMPERFLTNQANVDVLGQHFELIPFGSGRRSCPGITLALQVMHLTVARLIQGFSIKTPLNAAVDMSEGLGITLPKETPLEVQITPRLCPKLYECQM